MPRLLLVDGSNYFYRAHYAMPELRNSKGMYTGALYGMISMLRKLRSDYPSEYLACVFDAKGPTFRHVIFPEYKANRGPMPEELISQIELTRTLTHALGWQYLAIQGIEADDIIGTLSKNATENGLNVLIATGDKDMAQLVNSQIHLIDTMNARYMDVEGVIGKFGVKPKQIIDYLTLMGDTSDNIPGVQKVGPKTAAKWLNEYQTLEELLAKASSIKGVVGENLQKAIEWLPVTKKLITIHQDCEDLVSEHLKDWQTWRCFERREEDIYELQQLFKHLEFKSWLYELYKKHPEINQSADLLSNAPNNFNNSDHSDHILNIGNKGADAEIQASLTLEAPYQHQYRLVNNIDEFNAWLGHLNQENQNNNHHNDDIKTIAIDTETTHLNVFQAKLVGVSLAAFSSLSSIDTQKPLIDAIYIPIQHGDDANQQADTATLQALKKLINNPKITKVAQNLKYDLHILQRHGFLNDILQAPDEGYLGFKYDTMLASYLINSQQSHGLDALIEKYLPHHKHTLSYAQVSNNGQLSFDQVAIEQATQYAAEDAAMTLELHYTLLGILKNNSPQLLDLYLNLEVPLVPILQQIEQQGIRLNLEFLAQEGVNLEGEIKILENQIFELAGQSFNLHSPKQIADVFFEKLALPVLKKTPQKSPSTDEEVLNKLAINHPIARLLLQHRSFSKLKNTYIDKLPLLVDENQRVHTQFTQHITSTGRLSSAEPNLQNIPIRTEQGRRIRQAFIAKEGCCIVGIDYSQIELRLLAHFSKDPNLIQAFLTGQDIHLATAARVFYGDVAKIEDVTNEQRRYAKSINFGLIYGMSAFGLANQLNIEVGKAQHYIDQYFAQYPSILSYLEELKQFARDHGFVQTLLGRRIYIPEINNRVYMRRQGAERLAINAPMQGSAADLIKLAMIAINQHIQNHELKSKMVLQVHDELLFEVPYDEINHIQTHFRNTMEAVYKLNIPLIANLALGENWDEAH